MIFTKKKKKNKKALQREKNRKQWERFLLHQDALEHAHDSATPEIKEPPRELPRALSAMEAGQNVTKRLDKLRARSAKRRSKSKERWNRFSGTSGAGARGL